MCRQRCALIVARCACACACMSARVNACSSTAGLDLTTSSGDHRARAPTTWPRLWCANGRFHPALTWQSAVPEGLPSHPRQERRRPTSTARPRRWGRPAMITEADADFFLLFQTSFAKVAKPRPSPWSCCQHRLSRPSTSAVPRVAASRSHASKQQDHTRLAD